MAESKKKGYPKLPRANWFALREKFRQKPPAEVTPTYIAGALNIGTASAANLVPPLKQLGLIDESGKPTDLAFEWRDDATYAAACEKILEATYPQEIRDLFHTPDAKFKDVSNWFARDTRQGESVVTAYTSLYLLLLEADPTKKDNGSAKKAATPKAPKAAKAVAAAPKPAKAAASTPTVEEHGNQGGGNPGHGGDGGHRRGFSPNLHVDIQIHISPDSTPEQIDRIFESMAKHLPIKG